MAGIAFQAFQEHCESSEIQTPNLLLDGQQILTV